MAQSIDLSANAMVGLTRETLVSLCAALLRENGSQAAMHLQNAGYAGEQHVVLHRFANEVGRPDLERLDLRILSRQA